MQWLAQIESTEEGQFRVLRLPAELSQQLSSRGMNMARVTVRDETILAPLEPDGHGSHWLIWRGLPWDGLLQVQIELIQDWPEPTVPQDMQLVVMADPRVHNIWVGLTHAAKWDWIRWVEAAKTAPTRTKRLESIPSRLQSGKRRPCCFDRTQATLTDVIPRIGPT